MEYPVLAQTIAHGVHVLREPTVHHGLELGDARPLAGLAGKVLALVRVFG
jgi:hypothetical protein